MIKLVDVEETSTSVMQSLSMKVIVYLDLIVLGVDCVGAIGFFFPRLF